MSANGERMVAVFLSAEAWSHVADALALGLQGFEFGYELRFGGTQLRDALAVIERAETLERDALIAAVHDIDAERGYIVPFDTDHVHKVERDTPPSTFGERPDSVDVNDYVALAHEWQPEGDPT